MGKKGVQRWRWRYMNLDSLICMDGELLRTKTSLYDVMKSPPTSEIPMDNGIVPSPLSSPYPSPPPCRSLLSGTSLMVVKLLGVIYTASEPKRTSNSPRDITVWPKRPASKV